MRFTYLCIKNFKSIDKIEINNIEDVLIFVGRNNSGKSVILDAIRAVCGDYKVKESDFNSSQGNICIKVRIAITSDDLLYLHRNGIVKNLRHFDLWKKNFCQKFASYHENVDNCGEIEFEYVYGRDGNVRYRDGYKKNNVYIKEILPKIYFVDNLRKKTDIKEDLIMLMHDQSLTKLKEDRCIFDNTRKCCQCFDCIGVINKKTPQELSLIETSRLLQYKLFSINLNEFARKLNGYFMKNGAKSEQIHYKIAFDSDEVFKVNTIIENTDRGIQRDLSSIGEGLRSLYILSLLETYVETGNVAPYIIMIEDPELYLHPHLQKVASEILYKLSKKNQVIFSTHEPEMLFNFTSKQIKQVYADADANTSVMEKTDIDSILDDLGYTANDFMNVSFVFIVEGKQDKNRLPLLLEHYYSEVSDKEGNLKRIAIIATNSCTNIKTYANLKYINKLYLKDRFIMIRDSDGKDKDMLTRQLCKYYADRADEDKGNIPRVTDKNVIILKYYSFENYFLFPEVMAKIGVIKNVDEFYDILWEKYQEYLYRLSSVKHMLSECGITINSREDIINNIENIRIYVRGHNLYDIFYGRFKKNEKEILSKYITEAPREIFKDILDQIDGFVFFNSRKVQGFTKKE